MECNKKFKERFEKLKKCFDEEIEFAKAQNNTLFLENFDMARAIKKLSDLIVKQEQQLGRTKMSLRNGSLN